MSLSINELSGGSRGGAVRGTAPLPPYLRVWMTGPLPYLKVWIRH